MYLNKQPQETHNGYFQAKCGGAAVKCLEIKCLIPDLKKEMHEREV